MNQETRDDSFRTAVRLEYVCARPCGIALIDRSTLAVIEKRAFSIEERLGDICRMTISDVDWSRTAYCFYDDDGFVTDTGARAYMGGHVYGKRIGRTELVHGARPALVVTDTGMSRDSCPEIPYTAAFGYCMHVRGFTRHASSGVSEKHRGTFAGIIDKIPYLLALGVTTLELQPAYEFSEIEMTPTARRINYWGYTEEACYYAPKASYSSDADAVSEFASMVRALHAAGIQVVMQFYFGSRTSKREIGDILRWWLTAYHIDGFHIKGDVGVPEFLLDDPAFARCMLWNNRISPENVDVCDDERLRCRRPGEYRDDFRFDVRHFLRGDEGSIERALECMRRGGDAVGKVNYLTNYDGFTLMDLVTYNYKNNSANGEDGVDGTSDNISWNCGQEGRTRRKTVQRLRLQQMKNALALLFTAQGMPLIFMGDEFGHSQGGNNNPYCLDNATTWLNWDDANSELGQRLTDFIKSLVQLRRAHGILHVETLRLMDVESTGYPDLSYHGEQPWRPDLTRYSHTVGLMYAGAYAGQAGDFVYIAYNMHWQPHRIALPRLPEGHAWRVHLATCDAVELVDDVISVPARSVSILVGGDADG